MLARFGVPAGISARAIDDSNAFVLIENCAGQVTGDQRIVVRVRNHQQDVSFVAAVGSGYLRQRRSGDQNNGQRGGKKVKTYETETR